MKEKLDETPFQTDTLQIHYGFEVHFRFYVGKTAVIYPL